MNKLVDFGVVDTHCHMWSLQLVRKTWLSPEFKKLFKSFGPRGLRRDSRKVGTSSIVLIESGESTHENVFLERIGYDTGFINAVLPYVNLESPNLESELTYWEKNPKFRGIRHRFEIRSDREIISRPGIVKGLLEVVRRGLVFEFSVRSYHLRDIISFYERAPDLKGVIEHMAKPNISDSMIDHEWYENMKTLARNTSIVCKLSLSPTLDQMNSWLSDPISVWPVEPIKPYVQFLLEEFGVDRLMWGSDWPLCLMTGGYAKTYQSMRDAIGSVDYTDELRLFRTTAIRFYGLEE